MKMISKLICYLIGHNDTEGLYKKHYALICERCERRIHV